MTTSQPATEPPLSPLTAPASTRHSINIRRHITMQSTVARSGADTDPCANEEDPTDNEIFEK